ncbi:MAG TPA: DegT/DnrJ/EryC1/StrS family aminotransferase [Nitrospiria bacterium]|nr:DegT/DnrJ/EryC1/StrS family aminotransferase [Nitrospiria bacterium]
MIPHSKPWLTAADARAVAAVVRGGQLSPSPLVERFERAAARTLGVAGAAAVSSGTAALYLTLRALGVGPRDHVLMPSYVCSALLHATEATGATALLVDGDPETFNLAPDDAKRRLRRRTKAVIVPHLFGMPADLTEVLALGPPVIEDCAQTLGVPYHGRPVGSYGVAAVCSFYATKLVAAGEGGMVASDSSALLAKIRDGRSYDERPRYSSGFNFKLSGLHAALGLSQLSRLPLMVARRRRIARRYDRALAGLPWQRPVARADRGHAFHRYVVRVPGGLDRVMARLALRGVTARRPVFRPLHHYFGYRGFPVTDRLWRASLSLPIYPSLTSGELKRIVAAISEAADSHRRSRP